MQTKAAGHTNVPKHQLLKKAICLIKPKMCIVLRSKKDSVICCETVLTKEMSKSLIRNISYNVSIAKNNNS